MGTRMFEEIGKHLCSGPNDLDSVIDLDAFLRIRLFPSSLQRCMGNSLARLFQRFQEKMLSSILRYNTIMILMQLLRYLMKFFS